VVATRELQDPVAARARAREADGAHRRLGARRDEPHLLDGRHGVDDLSRELHLALRQRAEARPVPRGPDDGGNRLRVGMAE
jgi:hypothetical protein